MKILIVLAHPEIQSMNGAMFSQAKTTLEAAGHQVKESDLYRMAFNPVSDRANFTTVKNPAFFKQQLEEMYAWEHDGFAADLAAEQEKVEWCDLMIWQFPLWWFSVPGILKGWVDRVFAMGRFYGNGRIYGQGVFQGKKAMLSLTTGGDAAHYVAGGTYGDLLNMLKPIHHGVLAFTGFTVLHPQVVSAPARNTPEGRAADLHAWKERLHGIFSEEALTVTSY
ncbi:flavodoxin family protein [Chitinophaga parva]|uniref:Flavodoxin family protein n=1 Tax=Chitinophaga parva TaxID=2169414 RepID=A0A2T7BD28_9BACT|nr:NAD(P)H-dependent oxidoreductase [Chitinophaga parva]PUZ22982.1 flavodoxin family protein [Chitinophaga parva]